MNETQRIPGLVNEESVPMDATASEPKSATTPVDSKTREPHGEVLEPTVALPLNEASTHHTTDKPEHHKIASRLTWTLALFGSSWLLYLLASSLANAWTTSPYIAIPLGVITLLFVFMVSLAIYREWKAFKTIDHIASLHQLIAQSKSDGQPHKIRDALEPVIEQMSQRYPDEIRRYRAEVGNRRTMADYQSLLNNVVLLEIDKDVQKIIHQASLSVAGLVAISPHPALDALVVAYRANLMIKKIATCYGLQPTGLSSLYLFRQVLIGALTAATIDKLGSLAVEEIGAGVAEKTLSAVAEGVVSAGRMYRLGQMTKRKIRPL